MHYTICSVCSIVYMLYVQSALQPISALLLLEQLLLQDCSNSRGLAYCSVLSGVHGWSSSLSHPF